MKKLFNCRWYKDFDENIPYQWSTSWCEFDDRFTVVKEKYDGDAIAYFYNVFYLRKRLTLTSFEQGQIGFVSEARDSPKYRYRYALLNPEAKRSVPVDSVEDGIDLIKARFLLEYGGKV